MSSSLIPQAFWFRVALDCRRLDGMPKDKTRLLDLPESCTLPSFRQLDHPIDWARVRAAWSPEGLGFSFELTEKVGQISSGESNLIAGDSVTLWIDTRDTRTIHRATRFCHRFHFAISSVSGTKSLKVTASQKEIARAQADAPTAPSGSISARAERILNGWRLEVFLAAAALSGYDPETNRRLGFNFEINDADRGAVNLGVGREFPIGEDPSLWGTLVLTDESA